jgi:putative heme iron utilization protein
MSTMQQSDALAFEDIQRRSYAAASATVHASWPPECAMGAAAIRAFLQEHRYATVATTRPNGRPQASPLSFVVHDAQFWFAVVAGQRLRNLRHVPYVALVISEGDGDGRHRMMLAEGGAAVQPVTDRLAQLWAEREGAPASWAEAIVSVTPDRVFSYARA